MLVDFRDILERTDLADVEVRAVSEGGQPVLSVRGALGEVERQRLRNVLGQYSLVQIRSGKGPAPSKR